MWKPARYEERLRALAARNFLISWRKDIGDKQFAEFLTDFRIELGAQAFCESLELAIIELHPMRKAKYMSITDLGSAEFEHMGRWLFEQYFKPSGKFITVPPLEEEENAEAVATEGRSSKTT